MKKEGNEKNGEFAVLCRKNVNVDDVMAEFRDANYLLNLSTESPAILSREN